jgi:hypothetical protein
MGTLICLLLTAGASISTQLHFGAKEGKPHALSESESDEHAASLPDVLVLMVDTRNTTHDDLIRSSSLVNYLYARKHGYDFRFVQFVDETGKNGADYKQTCGDINSNVDDRVVLPSVWCRLLVVLEALNKGYKHVIHLDADALFSNPSESLAAFLQRTANYSVAGHGLTTPSLFSPTHYDPTSPVFKGGLRLDSASLILPTDIGFYESNCGLQIWRNGPAAKR